MKLIVGPGQSRGDLVGNAQRAWEAFEKEFGGPVFPYSSLHFEAVETSPDIACADPRIGWRYQGNKHVRVVLSERFFRQPPQRQTLTLLHESIHLVLICNGLRERTIEARERDIRHGPSALEHDVFEFESDRRHQSMVFYHFVDEILAEHYLQRYYPRFTERRLACCLEARRDHFSRRTHTKVRPELLPYAHLYERLRNELGVQLAADQPQADEFNAMIDSIDLSWREMCSDDDQRQRLCGLRPRLLRWGLEPMDFDPDVYESLFDEMVALPPITV